MRKEINLDFATRLINHGPVVLVTSLYNDKANITPVAWTMPINKKPPMVALEIGQKHFIFECIKETKDFAINIVSPIYAEDLLKCGKVSGREVDKFEKTSFTKSDSKIIKSPGLAEALAVVECKLIEDKYLEEEYNIVVGEVMYAEVEEEAFNEHWLFNDDKFKTLHHLGDKTFCFPDGKIIDLR